MKKDVGRRLREARERAGFSSAEAFAAHIKAHPNSVYRVERGKQWIGPEMLERIAGGLRLSPAMLFDDVPPSREPTPQQAPEVLAKAIQQATAPSPLTHELEAAQARIRELEALQAPQSSEEIEALKAENARLKAKLAGGKDELADRVSKLTDPKIRKRVEIALSLGEDEPSDQSKPKTK